MTNGSSASNVRRTGGFSRWWQEAAINGKGFIERERINGRIERDYQFERHTIRGSNKMTMFITVSFLIYMALTKSKIEKGQTEHLCKLYA